MLGCEIRETQHNHRQQFLILAALLELVYFPEKEIRSPLQELLGALGGGIGYKENSDPQVSAGFCGSRQSPKCQSAFEGHRWVVLLRNSFLTRMF